MSFILDALKKSESDRQRQGGPALFEVKVAAPRHALPSWAVTIAVLFVANLAVVGWLLLRHAAAPAEAPAPVPARAQGEAAPGPAPPAAPAVPPSAAPPGAPTAATPAVAAPSTPAAAAQASRAAPAVVTAAPGPAAPAEAAPNPDDLAPAAEPPPASAASGRVKRGTDAGVPLYQQLAATPGAQLPQLRLDLHAYAERAEDRWVLINMHKLHEGDSLEGARLERITPDGAVLSYLGTQFLLTRE